MAISREAGENLRHRALEAISELPGVQSAAYANSLPLNIDQSSTVVYPDDRPDLQRSGVFRAVKYQVSPEFFRTLGIRLLQGRDVDWRDSSTSRRVAVVNEAFARQIPFGRGTYSDDISGMGLKASRSKWSEWSRLPRLTDWRRRENTLMEATRLLDDAASRDQLLTGHGPTPIAGVGRRTIVG